MTTFKFGGMALLVGGLQAQFAWAEPLSDVAVEPARPLPLAAVRLTGGPLKRAQDLDAAYLLRLEPDRMLAYYRVRAGLAPKAKGYGGWDGDGHNLTGHIAGHYLSAVSLMYAATGDERFKGRADYLVQEFKEIQDKNGNGYLGALEDGQKRFDEVSRGNIRSGGFDLNGLWSPWYVLHKTFAGLRDAYRFTGNLLALEEETKFAVWVEQTVKPLADDQTQTMLNTEFGGMNEVLVDLYQDTGDRRWLDLSYHFEHRAVMTPLKNGQDKLAGLHANTQVPKVLGTLAHYRMTGNMVEGRTAAFFWDTVVNHHSFATGGHGKDEYFGPPDELSARPEGRTDESCNVYNMLKMTRQLFALQPSIKYADFEERALFNHVLGSIDSDGNTCYMVPVGQGVRREYQDMFGSFTCCVGTGMENHALNGDGIYYEGTDAKGDPRLWVNLYAPSTLAWKTADASLALNTDFPEGGSATLTLTLAKSKNLSLLLRRPAWAGAGFGIKVNGKAVESVGPPDYYVELKRKWKSGDMISLALPKTLHAEPLPDNPGRVALMWGPLVLAGDMGPEDDTDSVPSSPVFVAAGLPLEQWLRPVAGKPGEFQSVNVGRDTTRAQREKEVDFEPFYRLQHRTYTAYWDVYTPGQWTVKSAQIAMKEEKQRQLKAATVAFVQPGEMQPERDFNQQGESTQPTRTMGVAGRKGRNWFSFDVPVDAAHPTTLIATYSSDEWLTRTFDVLVDGQKVASQVVTRELPGHFYDVEYTLPATLLQDKTKITVRFQASGGSDIAGLYGLRTIRADAPR